MNVNAIVEDIANYFLALYMLTDYQCDRCKLQKLIFFSDLLYFATSGSRLLNEKDLVATERSVALNTLSSLYSIVFNYKNERNIINENLVSDETNLKLNDIYNFKLDNIDSNVRKLLRYTFCQFGAYSMEDLTKIARKTSIWKNARRIKPLDEVNYITTSLYNSFLLENIQHTDDLIERRNRIVEYLRGLLSDDM